MAERISALAELAAPPRAEGEAALRLSELAPASIVQLQAFLEGAEAFGEALGETLGLAMPENAYFAEGEAVTLVSLGVGRLLVLSGEAELAAKLRDVIGASGTVTDLSHARTLLSLEGAAAQEVLARGIAIDLARMPPGAATQTKMEHFDVTLLRRAGDCFELLFHRSFAEAAAEWLLDAGAPFGIAMGR
ncbi:sarcosine oxidase subunit gamma [Afifella pfennigii]|uniref:sarcosine oxidase subunit gamma n=1 Tax=Afifella pfennigii TaxID=209897 RepID=UPI00068B357F|nr:sarcosine oxidase subunit gamma family protein [Afifella pfennigii]